MADALHLNILGFPAANREMRVEIRDPVTSAVVSEAQPFLDGTVRVQKLPPGSYEVTLRHPNLATPVLRRPIRIFPGRPTKVSVVIDPSKFRDTPIEDIPEANLQPVTDLAASIGESLAPIAAKVAGEAILAEDWNALVGAVRDLAGAVAELTRLVTPTGHDHRELINKIEEIDDNFRGLIDSISAALTELQRQIQTQRFRAQVTDLLDRAAIDPASAAGREYLDIVENLERSATKTPSAFAREARTAGVQLQTKVERLIEERAGDTEFLESEAVKTVTTASTLLKEQRSTTYGAELEYLRKMDRTIGPAGIALGPR